jgi:Glycosyl hydrolase-like 10
MSKRIFRLRVLFDRSKLRLNPRFPSTFCVPHRHNYALKKYPMNTVLQPPGRPKTDARKEQIISDLSIAQPSQAVSAMPVQDRWVLIPYEGNSVSGQMLWSPARNNPPDVSIPLPNLGLCDIHIGIYASGTWPWYFNLIGVYGQRSSWVRLMLRLSDTEVFDEMVPANHPEEQRLGFVTETFWKTVKLDGQSLVLSPPRKEVYQDTCTLVAYIRLVPREQTESWPTSTKRLTAYFDSNYYGHYVSSSSDVKSMLNPLRDSDYNTILWTTCREDSCYYPSKVGNVLPPKSMKGVYPYWMGEDLHTMLARGEDPLRSVCEVGHDMGMKVFASYRRMTCRMPPFIFPLHPDAMFMKRRDLWCADPQGKPVPHLSIAYPEVRKRMIDLLVEQATNYDIDGVHFYFSRSVPFVYYERPFLEAFQQAHGIDPRSLPITDQRIWRTRAALFTPLLRELRQALDVVGDRRGKRFEIAMHAQNTLDHCLYYGVDVPLLAREGLLDIFYPDMATFMPEQFTPRTVTPKTAAEFVGAVHGTNTKVIPFFAAERDAAKAANVAAEFYRVGVDGLHPGHAAPYNPHWQIQRRLGHVSELSTLANRMSEWERIVRFETVGGMTIDLETGVTTCG